MVWDGQFLEDSEQTDESISQLVTKVFKEQPPLHRVC